jgi:hypothetical protein
VCHDQHASTTGLDTAWQAFRTAPSPVQALEGIVLLPWVLPLAIWEARWTVWLRLLVIAGLAWASLYMFLPWKTR